MEKVRVGYSPSPTGNLNRGNARAPLSNTYSHDIIK